MNRNKILELAAAEIGVTELPPNSNLTKYGQWFGYNGVPWCGIFCSWACAQAGSQLPEVGWLRGFCSVPAALKQWAHAITKEPNPADLVIFDWNKDKSPDHVGFFVAWLDKAAGTFETIEGNTSVSSNSNGGAVMKRQRNMAFVEAFIDIEKI